MKIFKKIISIVVATATLMAGTSFPVSAAEDTKIDFATGDLEVSKEEKNAFFEQYGCNITADSNINARSLTLPDYVDLSTSPFFPPIGHQGELKSCTSWATTYYQFTYEAHKLNHIRTSASNAYSPAWTYNYTNGGCNYGTSILEAYKVLMHQGALTMNEMPYYNTVEDYDFSWSTNTDAMIEALNTRITGVDIKSISGTGTPITSNKDSDLNEIKSLLNSGKMPVISVENFSDWYAKSTTSNPSELAIYRAGTVDNAKGHALTVVGYNDNITCDFNNNGTIEASERGAFKIANSWGTHTNNAGYTWVMYDTLNKVSANTTNNWQADLEGERLSAFATNSTSDNEFYFVNVENVEVGVIGKLHLNTRNKNLLQAYIYRGNSSSYNSENSIAFYNIHRHDSMSSFDGDLIMDFGYLDNPLSNLSAGYYFGLRLDNLPGTNSAPYNSISFTLIDNLKNQVHSYNIENYASTGQCRYAYNRFNLSKGDLNYDNKVDENDINILIDYILDSSVELSNLQSYLGDIDNNGDVALADLTALRKLVPSPSVKAYISSFINAYNTQQLSTFKRIGDSYEKK